MRNLPRETLPIITLVIGLTCLTFATLPARADDRNNDRIVRALERIAGALENPKCR